MNNQSDRAKRLAALGSRISHDETPASKTPPVAKEKPKRTRDRHTLYLDKAIVSTVDTAYKTAAHALFPVEISKSDYLEACLSFALTHQEEIKAVLLAEHTSKNE